MDEMCKCIFLDVDGVLNDYETKEKNPNGNTGIDDDKVERLSVGVIRNEKICCLRLSKRNS